MSLARIITLNFKITNLLVSLVIPNQNGDHMEIFYQFFSLLKIGSLLSTAYLDPGSGSFILQVLVASLVGIGFALRGYWGKIKSIFRKNQNDDDFSDEENE